MQLADVGRKCDDPRTPFWSVRRVREKKVDLLSAP
jgi:hypothetical protein